MANASDLKNLIEPYVRNWLAKRYQTSFEEHEKALELLTGGRHRFDAMSKDNLIVAGIKASAERESGSKRRVGAGAIKSAFTELYFLSLIQAKKKLLVLTNRGFYEIFKRRSKGKVWPDTEVLYCSLPKKLAAIAAAASRNARKEIGKTGF